MKKLPSLLAGLGVTVGLVSSLTVYSQPSHSLEALSSLKGIHSKPSVTNVPEAEVYNKLGIGLAEQGKFSEAIDAFNRAIEIYPAYENAYHNLGMTLGYQRKFPEAAAAFNRAIEINPNNYDTYNDLGIALGNQGKFSEAANAFKRSTQINPKEPICHQNLGMALWKLGNLPEAIASLQQARKLYSGQNNTTAVQQIERILQQIKAP